VLTCVPAVAIRDTVQASPFAQTGAAREAPAVVDKRADAYLRLCRNCHEGGLELVRRTRTGWQDILDQMVERGATGSDEDFGLVLEYLLRDHGKVNVNEAPAEELVLVLGLSAAESESVVAYRKEHGKFESVGALTAVPGVDGKKIDERRAAIVF
jgi:competence protein ComEA